MTDRESWRDVQTPDDRIEMLELQIRRRDHALDVQDGKRQELEAERDRLAAALVTIERTTRDQRQGFNAVELAVVHGFAASALRGPR